jgi:protein-S-isoprenylcysteine O-methyltransferase Ste14
MLREAQIIVAARTRASAPSLRCPNLYTVAHVSAPSLMNVYGPIIGTCWIAFFAIWFALAARTGTGRSSSLEPAMGVRLLLAALIVIGIMLGQRLPVLSFGRYAGAAEAVGSALCIVGLAFAAWARVTLGRSWGMPMTLHEKPELVTSGPYRYVRHPIYTGMSAMVIGSTLVFLPALAWCIGMLVYMIVSSVREERDMAQRFPEAYPKYKQRSKMLVPFVL